MTTAFLDAQIWNYLVDPDANSAANVDADQLISAAERHEIIGTFDVLQELMGTAGANAAKYERIVEMFFDLVGPRLLLPLAQRHILEAINGGLLATDRRFANREVRRDAKSAATKQQAVFEIADEVYAEGANFKRKEEAIRADLKRGLAEAGESAKPQRLREWYRTLDIDDLVKNVAEEGNNRGHYAIEVGEDCGPTRFPSLWMFTASRLARIPATLGEGRKIQPSDLADAHHVASGPYVDLFVTNDRELRRTIELMSCRALPFTCVDPTEFAAL